MLWFFLSRMNEEKALAFNYVSVCVSRNIKDTGPFFGRNEMSESFHTKWVFMSTLQSYSVRVQKYQGNHAYATNLGNVD